MDEPLSQSNVSLKLSEIQKRCEKLLDGEQLELSLEEPGAPKRQDDGAYDPYNRST